MKCECTDPRCGMHQGVPRCDGDVTTPLDTLDLGEYELIPQQLCDACANDLPPHVEAKCGGKIVRRQNAAH